MKDVRIFISGLIIALFTAFCHTSATADPIMERIKKTGKIRVGFRHSSIPFAYFDSKSGKHVGFSVDMAHLLAEHLSNHFGKNIKIQPVSINTENRIPMVMNQEIDVDMGASTYNLTREAKVDFSLVFFVSETAFMVKSRSGIRSMEELNGKKIGVPAGTTNLSALQSVIRSGKLDSENVVVIKEISQGFEHLKNGELDALCMDRTLLNVMRKKEKNPETLTVLDFAISYEPYAYMVPENSSDFRDFLNNTIRWSLNTGQFYEIYEKWMGEKGEYPIKMPPGFKEYLNVIAFPMKPDWWKR